MRGGGGERESRRRGRGEELRGCEAKHRYASLFTDAHGARADHLLFFFFLTRKIRLRQEAEEARLAAAMAMQK